MIRLSYSLLNRWAIWLVQYGPAIALLFYFLGGILPIFSSVPSFRSCAESALGLYSNFCHQMPGRSFHLDTNQMGFCARCTGLYGSLAVVSLYVAVSGRTKPISWLWLLGLCIPILLDVPLDFADRVAAANLLRMATGLLAGTAISLFLYPRVVAAARYSLAHRQDAL